MRSLIRHLTALLLLTLAAPRGAAAQVRPDLRWRTLTTEHFRIHFTDELEALAHRTAANAETAWARLSEELAPPRTMVDIVVADNVDYANGYATQYPTNRIVIYARPPVEAMALRNHEDWNRLLVTHELTHVFQLDRARGLWATAQKVFGRAAPLFPNVYAPSWILEGMAVHYETRFGGGGRLAGTEFPMYVRTAALEGALPPLDALSLATPRFPRGDLAYTYGAYAVTRADTAHMARYVDAASARLIPWRHDKNALDGFGETFTKRWNEWRDSVMRAEQGVRYEAQASTTLTRHGFTARFPRFTSETSLIYVADDSKRTTGLYLVFMDGLRERLGRRNSVDVSTITAPFRSLQGELDFTDPYSVHGDLYSGWKARRKRLTRGERLSSPDAHAASGAIVAVRTDPGTTSLVLVDAADDYASRDLARGTLDRTWAEPRFSRDGARVAAVRWELGGRSAVVVMDLAGREQRAFAPRSSGARAPRIPVVSSPVWEPGDSTLLFVSDHEGRAMVYRGDVRTGAYGRIWSSPTGLNTPDVSPDGKRIAAVEMHADGYHLVLRDRPLTAVLALPAEDTLPDPLRPLVAAATDTGAVDSRYSPFELLYPRWWLPELLTTQPGTTAYGLMSGATDAIGRHAWALEAAYEPTRQEWTSHLSYAYAGFGVPVLYLDGYNEWDHGVIRTNGGDFAGYLGQRSRRVTLDALFQRARMRFSTYVLLGGEAEQVDYRSYPSSLLPLLNNPALLRITQTQALRATVGFSTMQHPANAVSVEDGLSGFVTQRERFGAGVNHETVHETILAANAAKSVALPGFARHVLAVHGAYGVTSHQTTSALDVGGVSGTSLELLPGIAIGTARRNFGVRGFAGGTMLGTRAVAGSVEYRAPLALVGRGVRLLPFFFQKTSLSAFADAGSAWCEFSVANSFICPDPLPPRTTIASVGAEFALDASLQYDQVYRFRIGLAHPVRGEALAGKANTIYFTLGSAF